MREILRSLCTRAQLVARKDSDLALGVAGIGQLGGMADIGGGEHIHLRALLDALAQKARGSELHLHFQAAAVGLERTGQSVSAAFKLPAA